MRSNFKAICTSSIKWQSEFEGVLLLKDKKSNYTEHWCRLKGNLLVFCKTSDRMCEEIFGIIILEYFTIEGLNVSNNQNAFRLVFKSGDAPIILVAKSKEEYFSWKQHISEARCNSFTQKIQALKEEVILLQKQHTDIDSASKGVDFVDEGADNGDKSGLEITLSCENLPHYAIETHPNPSISVYIQNSFTKEEKVHSTTEIVQDSRNPEFHKIIFIPETLYDPNIQVKFVVYDIRDIGSHTRHKIGVAEVSINLLLSNSNIMMKFKDGYNRPMESILRIQVQEYQSKNVKSETIPEVRSYQMMIEHNLSKSYSFPSAQNKSLRICEMMGESKFGLSVSAEYLKKLFAEESLLQESLSRFGSSDTQLEQMRIDRHIAIRENMSKYENILNSISQLCAEDKKFHPSCKKREFMSSFLPINLHINRILISDDKTNEMTKHLDIISVGAFAAHCLKFKNGGLLQTAKNTPESQDKNSTVVVANSMIRHYVHLVQHFSDQLKHLSSYTSIPNDIKEDLEILEIKMSKFSKFFQHQYFMSLSLEQVRKDYQQLTSKMKNFIDNHCDSETSIKIIQVCADKFKQSIDSISLLVINILWPKILYSFNESMNLDWAEFSLRENMAISQALTSVISGIALACNTWTSMQWSQMAICGIPLYFEGLLTSYGDEIGMIEDMKWVINKLVDFTVIIKPDLKAPTFNFISLKRIEISCFFESWKNAPMEIRMKKQAVLHLHPYFLNVGINEQQTFADKISKNNLLQTVNMSGYTSMKDYFERHVKNIGDSLQTCQGAEIIDSLNDLLYEIQKNKNKPVKILRIAEKISWAWSAIRFTSCKSAKDRTGMGVSLEQVRWLKNVAEMKPEYFTKALECIRSTGLRRNNCLKNSKSDKYALNTLQLLSFPKNYKAPDGTYGSNES